MEAKLAFQGKSSSAAITELEKLWSERNYDAVYNRCFADDVNFTIFAGVMRALSIGNYMPKKHVVLWQAIEQIAAKLPAEPSKAFLFNESVLPGNGLALSYCADETGNRLAYSTVAATKLQDEIKRKGFTKEELAAALQCPNPIEVPHLINIVQFEPYKAWSIDLPSESGKPLRYTLKLLGISGDELYAIDEASNSRKRLFRLALDGTGFAEILPMTRMPGQCYRLDVQGRKFHYIDLDSGMIVSCSLDQEERVEVPLSLPEGLDLGDLHELLASPEGKTFIVTVNNRTEEHRQVFGLMRRDALANGESAPAIQTRWFVRKELPRASFFTNASSEYGFNPDGSRRNRIAFYLLDSTGNLFTIDEAAVTPAEGRLADLDGRDVLEAFTSISTDSNPFAQLAVARRVPFLASYEPKARVVRLWDTARHSRLLDFATPTKIEAMSFAHDDRLLVTVSRNTNSMEGRISITFLDYILLSGRPVMEYDADDLMRLKALLAFAPDDVELKLMEQVIKYFATVEAE